MSSGFVSAGTGDQSVASTTISAATPQETDAWAAARAAVEESKKPKVEDENRDERSLFEILQANKARKQEEFEESLKFKNQFKPLDEDDVEYLDSIVATERRTEAARKRELDQQLDAFRQQQSEADRTVDPVAEVVATEEFGSWGGAGRKKRRREKEDRAGGGSGGGGGGVGVKVRKASSGGSRTVKAEGLGEEKKKEGLSVSGTGTSPPLPPPSPGLKKAPAKPPVDQKEIHPKPVKKPVAKPMALVAYGSDEDSD